ncbi:MAG: energy transducer TonB [Terriglobales bacterium]|jgi:TonB family protein
MGRNRPLALSILLIVCVIQPAALLSQDNSARETYDGVPVCQNRRGVFPHATYQPAPDYDDKARKKKIEGVVTLSTMVTTEGRTADIKLVKSLTPGLDQQAIKSVSRWRFEPVVQDGQPCPMRVNVQVQFKLY